MDMCKIKEPQTFSLDVRRLFLKAELALQKDQIKLKVPVNAKELLSFKFAA